MQATHGEAMLDSTLVEPDSRQLPSRNHSVLPLRQLGHHRVIVQTRPSQTMDVMA